jgi:hypothetical protein
VAPRETQSWPSELVVIVLELAHLAKDFGSNRPGFAVSNVARYRFRVGRSAASHHCAAWAKSERSLKKIALPQDPGIV